MTAPLRIALLGAGTVGTGVLELLEKNRAYLAHRVGTTMEIVHVVVRDGGKKRSFPAGVDPRLVHTDGARAVDDPAVDLVIEVMGGLDPAGDLIARALKQGKSVVTANKALLAERGAELLALASSNRADLSFEASVGGAIPVVRTLRDHLVSDWVRGLRGIVNGTCNYILTRMRDEGAGFHDVLAAAQALGYAEAEPSLDVDGHDAAHKLCVLALLAFGAVVQPHQVPTEGIRAIEPVDHRFAARFGFGIKHLASGREITTDGVTQLDLRVGPALVPARSPLASVDGVLNAIALELEGAGSQILVGRGAGALPTAVSIVADLVDVARARRAGVSGLHTSGIQVAARPLAPPGLQQSPWYLRMRVADRPGVLAQVAGALAQHDVSIEQLVQEGGGGRRSTDRQVDLPTDGDTRVIVLLTHMARESNIRAAMAEISRVHVLRGGTIALRIEEI